METHWFLKKSLFLSLRAIFAEAIEIASAKNASQ
jgi:hypothetical protein